MKEKACTACGSPHHLAAAHNNLPLAAIWFPPYGNSAARQNPAEGKPGTVTFSSALKAHEDRVAELFARLNEAERAIAYKYLYSLGLRIGTADDELRRAIRKELKNG
jgi:hypothetical protein